MNEGSSQSARRAGLIPAVFLALAVALAFQGSRGLYETTEGRYAEVAREMVATGDWMTPRLDGNPHWTKPPFAYWALAAGMEVFGANEWALRAFNALAFLGVAFAVYGLGRTMWDEETARLAMLITATSPFMVAGMNSISADMPLALWEMVAVLGFWGALCTTGAARAWRVNAMWAAFGLAFLTKGPPGLLPLLSILVFSVAARRRGVDVPRLLRVQGIAAFLVLAFGWYVITVTRDPSLIPYFLGDEVWGRIATGMHHRNSAWFMPVFIYGPVLTVGLGPWFFDALPLVAPGVRRLRERGGWRAVADSPPALFLALWVLVPLAVLSLSHSRLPLYVLPLLPAFALLLARAVVTLRVPAVAARRGFRLAVVGAVVCIAFKGVAVFVPSKSNMAQLRDAIGAHEGRVVAVDAGELYGLDFYLSGGLERTREQELSRLAVQLAERPGETVLVTPNNRAAALQHVCRNEGLECRIDSEGSRYYTICRVAPRP